MRFSIYWILMFIFTIKLFSIGDFVCGAVSRKQQERRAPGSNSLQLEIFKAGGAVRAHRLAPTLGTGKLQPILQCSC